MTSQGSRHARVKQLLAREWDIEPDAIPDDAALNGFERWDSLGHVTIVLALSAEFDFQLSAETVQALRSLPKIVEFLERHAAATTKENADEQPCAPSV